MKQKRYLLGISYFKDTLLVKSIYFKRNGDTSYVVNYLYDTLGRILSYKEGPISYKYDYETPNVTKKYKINNGEITNTEIEEYKDGNIVKLTFSDCFILYNYDKENRLVSEIQECLGSGTWKTIYIYK
jgi:hypothetical protein